MESFAAFGKYAPIVLGVIAFVMFFIFVPIVAGRAQRRRRAAGRKLCEAFNANAGVSCTMEEFEGGDGTAPWWRLDLTRDGDHRGVQIYMTHPWKVACAAEIRDVEFGFKSLILHPRGSHPGRGYGVDAQPMDTPAFDGRFDVYRQGPLAVWAEYSVAPAEEALIGLGQPEMVEAVGSLPPDLQVTVFARPDHRLLQMEHKLPAEPDSRQLVGYFRYMDRVIAGLQAAARGEIGPYR